MVTDYINQEEVTEAITEQIISIFKTYGWHKGGVGDSDIGYCLMGAAFQTEFVNQNQDWARQNGYYYLNTVRTVVEEQYPDRIEDYDGCDLDPIACFNDHPDTTFEDIEKILEKVRANG